MTNDRKLIFLILFGFWISTLVGGCARTVTQMPTYGNEMLFEITLQGNYDVINNKYFIVFSTMEGYQIALPQPDGMDEFLVPGDLPQPGGISTQEYFSKYYSTWTGAIVIDSQGYQLIKGPFNINNTISREVFATLDNVSNKLIFTIDINRIYGSTLPRNIYLDIITASYPAGTFKSLKDRISPPVYSFEPIKGSVISYNDTDQVSLAEPSLNITNWKVTLP